MQRPLCVDLFCGLLGWSVGMVAAGWRVLAIDIEDGGARHDHVQFVLQDVLTIDGRAWRGKVGLIVASPPCQAYSYRAMPWKRAKALPPPDNSLFDACFRIAREAECPLIVENVKGAQPWVGSARWHYGSFYLWGDVPALMPTTIPRAKVPGQDWNNFKNGKKGEAWNDAAVRDQIKNNGGSWFAVAHNTKSGHSQNPVNGRKGTGGGWFSDADENGNRPDWRNSACLTRRYNSKSLARKAASAAIAKIPFDLAHYIGQVFRPTERGQND